jgi:hypothetical protein
LEAIQLEALRLEAPCFKPRGVGMDAIRIGATTPPRSGCFGARRSGCYPERPFSHRIATMTDTLPDRLSNDPRSPFHDAELLERGVGIRFNGQERNNVEEYCVSEGWIRVIAGKALDRRGQPMTLKLKGMVEAYVKLADE